MECEEVQHLRETLKVKMWQQTGNDLWSMEVFLTVTNKDGYEQERFIITTYWRSFWKDPGDSPKQPKYCAPPNTSEKKPETLYQEDNTCALLRLNGHDYMILGGGVLLYFQAGSGYFWGFKIPNFIIFGGFQKKIYFLGV